MSYTSLPNTVESWLGIVQYSEHSLLATMTTCGYMYRYTDGNGDKPIEDWCIEVFKTNTGALFLQWFSDVSTILEDYDNIEELAAEEQTALDAVLLQLFSVSKSFALNFYLKTRATVSYDMDLDVANIDDNKLGSYMIVYGIVNNGSMPTIPEEGTPEWDALETYLNTTFPDGLFWGIYTNPLFTTLWNTLWTLICIIRYNHYTDKDFILEKGTSLTAEEKAVVTTTLIEYIDAIGIGDVLDITAADFENTDLYAQIITFISVFLQGQASVGDAGSGSGDIATTTSGQVFLGNKIPASIAQGLTIDPNVLSITKIMETLKDDALSVPENQKWEDWLESSAGTIILRWVASIAASNNYNAIVNRFENSIEFARHESSVYEHGFNRGFCVGATTAPELTITFNNTSAVDCVIATGELIGYVGDYSVYAKTAYSFTGIQNVIGIVGTKNEFTRTFAPLLAFTELEFELDNTQVASQLETFKANGVEKEIYSDLEYTTRNISGTKILRRIVPNKVIAYVGNGTVGWFEEDITEITYSVISYETNVTDSLASNFTSLVSGADYTSYIVSESPTFALSKEDIRGTAIYYPIDGRIVKDIDYEAVISKFFGSVLNDIYSFNTDPDQEVHLLTNGNWVDNQSDVEALVDIRRALGINVTYTLYDESEGVSYTPKFKVSTEYATQDLYTAINTELQSLKYKFSRVEYTLDSATLAVQLTNTLGINIYPNTDETLALTEFQFLNSITATVEAF